MASAFANFSGIRSPAASLSARKVQIPGKSSSLNMVSFGASKVKFISSKTSRLQICCEAKPETIDKVIQIVRKQLAIEADKPCTAESKFADLGADSLDTVEIVMEFEEKFGITMEEESTPDIKTVQDAANLIEALMEGKPAA